jgi:hypothetical protein
LYKHSSLFLLKVNKKKGKKNFDIISVQILTALTLENRTRNKDNYRQCLPMIDIHNWPVAASKASVTLKIFLLCFDFHDRKNTLAYLSPESVMNKTHFIIMTSLLCHTLNVSEFQSHFKMQLTFEIIAGYQDIFFVAVLPQINYNDDSLVSGVWLLLFLFK